MENGNEKFLIVGSGGRESAIALRLMRDTTLYAVIDHKNPTIIQCVEKTGGAYSIGKPSDPHVVLDAAKRYDVDYVFVSADDPLSKGVIDILLENDIKAVGGTKEATRIEWDKIYAMEMMQGCCPAFTPFYRVVAREEDLGKAVGEFVDRNIQVVVKPQGLTGGKGVKVMPEHLKTYRDCKAYATQLLRDKPDEKVLLVEKLNGPEFTVMGITDGEHLVMAPATYDYPFRLENDKGPGTGGMGCFTASNGRLPFIHEDDMRDCKHIMQCIIDGMRHKGLFFNGILNGGFFKTSDGIKFMEFNARFGDPEALNVLMALEGSLAGLIKRIWAKKLAGEPVRFLAKPSVIKYLVAKEYPSTSPEPTSFTVDEKAVEAMGITLFFASCVQTGPGSYTTLKKSRVVALGAVSDRIENASARIDEAIDNHISGGLEYRRDIGSPKSLQQLATGV